MIRGICSCAVGCHKNATASGKKLSPWFASFETGWRPRASIGVQRPREISRLAASARHRRICKRHGWAVRRVKVSALPNPGADSIRDPGVGVPSVSRRARPTALSTTSVAIHNVVPKPSVGFAKSTPRVELPPAAGPFQNRCSGKLIANWSLDFPLVSDLHQCH